MTNLIDIIIDYLNSCPSFWKEHRKYITDIPCEYFKDYRIVCCREVEHYGSLAKDGCAISILEKEGQFYINIGSAKIDAPPAYKESKITILYDYIKKSLDKQNFNENVYAVLFYFLNQIKQHEKHIPNKQ